MTVGLFPSMDAPENEFRNTDPDTIAFEDGVYEYMQNYAIPDGIEEKVVERQRNAKRAVLSGKSIER